MPIVKLWSSDHKEKKAVSISDVNIDQILEKAKEKNIYGTKIFLLDGTQVDDDEVLKEFQNEVLIIAHEEEDKNTPSLGSRSIAWVEDRNTPSLGSRSTASDLTVPNSPTSSIESNINDFIIPFSKIPSALLSKLNNEELISLSDVNTIVRTVADELICHKKLLTRANYRAIARELCDRFPQLYDRDEDTKQLLGTGYYTIFKKIEERVHYLQRPHKSASNSTCSDTRRKKSKLIKNLSSGCKEWQPSDPVINEDEEMTPETQKTWLISNASLKERDESKVELYMKDTYALQRTFLNTIPAPAVTVVANEWPVLLEEKYMIIHFDRLCGLNSDLCMETFLSKAPQLHKQISALLPKKQRNSSESGDIEKNDINLLQLIAKYFKEDLSYIYAKYEEQLTKPDIVARVKTTAPNIIVSGIDNISYLLVENTIVSEVSTFKSSVQTLIAAYYNFNMAYPVECQNTLEFVQRYCFKINPNEGSKIRKGRMLSKVFSLMAKLKSK